MATTPYPHATTMRAVVHDRYGPPTALRMDEVSVPTPATDQVLVRVHATSVNLSDWECLRGSPLYARIGGLRTPARRVLGSDVAGRVVAVGSGVERFRLGDAVYGDNLQLKGGFAEFAVAPEHALAHKPDELSFAEASTIPQSGAIALQGTAGARPSCRVLINGAGGGSGAFAIQLAKQAGAHVSAVDNETKLDFMRSLGADHVIDYRRSDFTKEAEPFDLVVDLVATRSVLRARAALRRGGRYRCVGGSVPVLLWAATIGNAAARLAGRRLGVLAVREGPTHFVPLAERCVTGEIDIHIGRTYGLDQVPEALATVGEGRALGKIVVEIDGA